MKHPRSARIGGNPRRNRAYRRWRAQVLDRIAPEGRCADCGRRLPLELHHLHPIAAGGPAIIPDTDIEHPARGVVAVCRPCHCLRDHRNPNRPATPGEQAWADLLDRL